MTIANPTPASGSRRAATSSRLMVLMFTDVVGSVDLKGKIGTEAYAQALSKHDAIFRRIIADTQGAEVLTDTGDGFFASFPSSSDAVRAALLFQQLVHSEAQPLRVRIGLHVGEAAQMVHEAQGRIKVVGLAADFASRLTHLAGGNQILMTRFPFNEARQFVKSHPEVEGTIAPPEIRWVAHGEYLFKGSDEPQEVFEVGAAGFAPLAPPADNEYARRAVRPGDEVTLGWRPANGLEMRNQPLWVIKEKLGEGGFGEVWLAQHAKTGARRVFKFCFDPHRLRGLKREVVLFRLLKDALGDRRDIVRVTDYQFDDSPYFIEYEYVSGGSLSQWADTIGGIEKVPQATRISLVARVAGALGAAHSVGVIHKDVKPSNVLIAIPGREPNDYETIYPVLTDFGIGILTDRTQLQRHDITEFNFTHSDLETNQSSRTGTRMYAPPESMMNRPYTVQGDVYALGVLLYQMTIGDLTRPLAEGWERDVEDDLVSDDIAACVQGDPARRLASANELATRLNSLPQRRYERDEAKRAETAAARRKQLVQAMAALLVLVIGIAAMLGIWATQRSRHARIQEVARKEAEAARDTAKREAAKANAMVKFFGGILSGVDANQPNRKETTVAEVLEKTVPAIEKNFKDQPDIEASLRFAMGNSYIGLGMFAQAEPQLKRSVELFQQEKGDSVQTAQAINNLGAVYQNLGDYPKAEETYQKALEMRRKLFGNDHAETGDTIWNLAIIAYYTNQHEKAEDYLRQSLAIREKLLGPESPQVAAVLQLLGMIRVDRGDIAEGQSLQQRSLAIREKALGPDHPFVGEVLTSVGEIDLRKRDFAAAEVSFSRALKIFEKNLPADHPHIGMTLTRLASTYTERGDFDRALPLAQRALDITERQLGKDNEATLAACQSLASVYQGLKEFDKAEQLNRRAVDSAAKSMGPDHPWLQQAKTNLARSLLFQDKPDEAEKLLQEVRAFVKHGDPLGLAVNDGLMVEVFVRRKQFDKAEPMAHEYLKRMQKFEPVELRAGMVANAYQVLTDLYALWGKAEEADKYRPFSLPTTQSTTQPTTAQASS